MPNKPTIFVMVNLGTVLKGTVSQTFYLGLSFYFMAKNGKHFAIFEKLYFLNCIKFDVRPKKEI